MANDLPTGGTGGVLAIGGTAHIGNDVNEMGDNLPFAKLGTNPAAGAPWKVKKVAAGNVHACAILQNDRVKCWGRNDGTAALGSGNNEAYGNTKLDDNIPFVDVGSDPATGLPLSTLDLAVGEGATCVLLSSGVVRCWGADSGTGTLGQGSSASIGDQPGEMGNQLVDVALKPGRVPTRVWSAPYSMCAQVGPSTLNCWGRNTNGMLGQGVPSSGTTAEIGNAPGELGAMLNETLLE